MKIRWLASPPATEASQKLSFTRRAMVLGGIQGGVGLLLAARMGWISIAENSKYTLLSESNRVNLTLIPPRRGWIVDRQGQPLANNRTNFRVDVIPERLVDADRTIATLAELLALAPDQVDRIKIDLSKAAGFQPVQIADKISYDQFATLSVRLPDLPGVAPAQGFSRNYPAGPSVGHLLGYVGAASAKDYEDRHDPLLITPGYKVGKEGLERSYDAALTGSPGAKRVEVTAHGKIVRELTTRPDVPGKSLHLTIDAGLQDYAGRRLGLQSGSVVVIDCWNGDVLAMASMPSFDPNNFSEGISRLEWQMLTSDDHVPLRNKTLQGLYPPGSTVKPMVALSFLEAGLDPDETTVCTGSLRVGNTQFHCWRRHGHGTVNMAMGIYQSCDIYFYHFAQKMGMPTIAAMAHRVGLGQKFDLPFHSQSYGTVPDPEWKLSKHKQPWAIYDTVNATIGQGYMLINPTQLAVMAARLASGRALTPNLLLDPHRPPAPMLGVSQAHLDIIHGAMRDVVNGHGTGGAARLPLPGVLMAGKTGTAQVRRISMAERAGGVRGNAGLPFKLRDHALFQGFAPFDKPRYAIGTIIEHGGHVNRDQDAPTISRDVMTYLFDPQKALDTLAPLETAWGGTPAQRMTAKLMAYRAANTPVVSGPVPSNALSAENSAQPSAPTQEATASPATTPAYSPKADAPTASAIAPTDNALAIDQAD